jgi:hypothetical protein
MPLRLAFMVAQMLGLVLLISGVFRFSLLWVSARSAGYAALAASLSPAISETVHFFGQLPTVFSLGLFLHGLPWVHAWIARGGWGNFTAALILAASTTAAHHVTTIFGGIFFVLPLGFEALRIAIHETRGRPMARRVAPPLLRGILLGAAMIAVVAVTILPYWIWSIRDPITQVPIPHGSRLSFI